MLSIETKVDSSEKLAAIAGKPTENYLFATEVNQIRDAVNELETLCQQNELSSENFGNFLNSITTEDDINDSDKFSFSDSSDSNFFKKTSWLNIKAKLSTVFNALFVPKTRSLTIGGITQDLSLDRTFEVSGGPDYLYETISWKALRFNSINAWRAPVHEENFFDNELLGNYGTGTSPADTSNGYPAAWHIIPVGYKIESIDLAVGLRQDIAFGSSTNLQVNIKRSEVNFGSMASAFSSTSDLVNQVLALGTGADRPKFIHELTVAANSAPTLNRSYFRIWARETTSTNCNYQLNFNVVYKKL